MMSFLEWFDLITEKKGTRTFGCIVIDNENNLLMIKTDSGLELPKGHGERGETPIEAAARETREETGVSVMVSNRDPLIATRGDRETHFYWAYPLHKGKPTEQETGIQGHQWVSIDDIESKKVVKWQRDIIEKIRSHG